MILPQTLVELICDVQAMEDTVMEMKYDAKKAPLGKFSSSEGIITPSPELSDTLRSRSQAKALRREHRHEPLAWQCLFMSIHLNLLDKFIACRAVL